jgi:hypothetical protein
MEVVVGSIQREDVVAWQKKSGWILCDECAGDEDDPILNVGREKEARMTS